MCGNYKPCDEELIDAFMREVLCSPSTQNEFYCFPFSKKKIFYCFERDDNMGKLMNMVPRNLFRRKMENVETVNKSGEEKTVLFRSNSSPSTQTILKDSERTGESRGLMKSTSQVDENSLTNQSNQNTYKINTLKESKHILASFENEDFEAKLYHVERSFLFEQNNIIEKFEREKREIMEDSKEEKLRMKRAYENEKTELLKEIERRDKMLVELSKVLKEESEKKLGKQREEILNSFKDKIELFTLIESKMKIIVDNLHKVMENNEIASQNWHEYNQLRKEFDTFSSIDLRNYGNVCSLLPDKTKENNTQCTCGKQTESTTSGTFDETSIQHELAQAYRKQKSELLKLFNSEKEEYDKKLSEEKHCFEKDVRLEYETRMSVERKAWQETIEDYEREISILKFERQQMDRNYCLGMDELKTEFEREKRMLHRSYSETHAEIKRSLELKRKT